MLQLAIVVPCASALSTHSTHTLLDLTALLVAQSSTVQYRADEDDMMILIPQSPLRACDLDARSPLP